ncbi:MAG: trypsin-like serine peptidase [Rhodospirillaceae bacterium]
MRTVAVAGLLMFTGPVLGASETPGTPVTVHAADISHYDCAAAAGPAAKRALHIGQVIQGRYYEWNEIYGGDNGETLLCVSLRVPQATQLDAAQAKAFLLQSAAIGIPTPGAATNPNIETQTDDLNAIPEPPKHVRPGPGATPGDTIPPVPAEHRPGDPQPPVVLPPIPEKPSGAPSLPQNDPLERSAAGDPRSEITAATVQTYPYNTIGYLTVTYPNNQSYRCTGTIVSPYVILTAGHCVHNNSRGGWVASARFYPAQYVSASGTVQRPYGSNSSVANLKTTQTWTQISGPDEFTIPQYRYDYAAIQFSTPFTHTATFMPVIYGSTVSTANNAGYPGMLKDSTATEYAMFLASGPESADSISDLRSVDVREFALYASGGDSGGPFWILDSQNRRSLVGSLSYSDDTGVAAGGPWYDSWNQSLLSSWVAWTPSTSPTAGLPITGLRLGAVYSSNSPAAQSFLRFYNSSTAAGTVSVTLSDYATGTPLTQWTSPLIPAGASPQFAISAIEAGGSQAFTRSNYYSLAIQSSFAGSFQHVLWRTADGSLTNLSTCDSAPANGGTTLINVHSSLLANGYPSQVVVFNTGATTANATLGIYDAATGGRIGTYTASGIPANGQVITTVINMENASGLNPGNRYHYNIKIENSAFTGFLQHLVNNQQSGVTSDMTEVCTLVRSTG